MGIGFAGEPAFDVGKDSLTVELVEDLVIHAGIEAEGALGRGGAAEELLAAHGVPAQKVFYLDSPPGRDEIRRVLALLGSDDPRTLMRTAEPRYRELGLAGATADELVEAMTRYPELIQRPVVIWADRAIIARPPELLLPLLETGRNPAPL